MAKSLTDLNLATRQHANVENNNFVTDAEVRNRLNEAKLALYDLIIDIAESAYAVQTSPTTLAGGFSGNTITLPADFYRMKGVDRSPGTTNVETIDPLPSFRERNSGGRYWMPTGSTTIAIVRPELAAGVYALWYYPIALNLWDPNIPIVATVDNVVAASRTWSFSTAAFDSTYVGVTMTVSGAANPGNNGTFTIQSVPSSTTLITVAGPVLVNETFGSAVRASAQPNGSEFTLDPVMAPFNLFLELHAARSIQAKRAKDTSDLTIRLEGPDGKGGERARVQAAVRHRRGGPIQVGRRRGGRSWLLGGSDGDL